MVKIPTIRGFSKLSKTGKLNKVADCTYLPEESRNLLRSFWHDNPEFQQLLDEFSENTISNFHFPFGVAPNFMINGEILIVPMVIEESSVVAAASNSARFWIDRGGFHSSVISTTKIGQVHFTWAGDDLTLKTFFPEIVEKMIERTRSFTANMEKRGGGILNIELEDLRHKIPGYYQIIASFDTRDAMGANFINTCLEEFAEVLKEELTLNQKYGNYDCQIIMSILSNYTPECLVQTYVECPVEEFEGIDDAISAGEFVSKFEKAVQISKVDVYRATTHNKGIFNGIDSVALATGNDFRAIEACGHAYAARSGSYKGLTDIEIKNNIFKYTLTVPLALGSVGGLTNLHPLAKFSLELMGHPSAEKLMMIASSVGLANNFSAIKSLITKGIQKGHMKMHLLNILNSFGANEDEKQLAVEYFKNHKVSYKNVASLLSRMRQYSH